VLFLNPSHRFGLAAFLLALLLPACSSSVAGIPQPNPTGAPPATIKLSVTSVTFTGDQPEMVEISQPGFSGKFTETNDCEGIARVSLRRNGNGKAELVVVPIGKGTCVITITGGGNAKVKLPVTVTPGPVEAAPTSLSFTTTGSSASQDVTVSQADFSKRFVLADNCNGVARVAATSNAKGQATYKVTPVAKGSCTATFDGGLQESASVFIGVEPLGNVNVKPSALAFTSTGSGAARNAEVSQSGYDGTFTESDDCSTIARLRQTSDANGSAAYTVTPLAKGDCVATFAGGNGEKGRLSISVAPPGDILVDPSSLQFDTTGSDAAQNVAVSQSGFSDAFKETDTCSGIATIDAIHNTNGRAKYRVTPFAKGTCAATFHGGHKETAPLSISVAPPGNVVVTPSSLSFDAVGSGAAKPAAVSQTDYTGSFGESDNCNGIATVVASTNAGGHASYTVTPVASGTCTATFSGGNKETAPLSISITPPPPGDVVVLPDSLTFTSLGPDGAQGVKVSQSHYDGAFTENDNCSGIAVVASSKTTGGGTAAYSVTALAKGSCSATFTGGGGKSSPLPVTVAPLGLVEVKPSSLTFVSAGSGAAQNVAISQSGYTGTFAESNTCTGIATVAQESNAGGNASYTVTPVANGDCVATFTGGNKESAPLSVAVNIPPPGNVVVDPNALTFTSTGAGSAQNVTVSQTGFSGRFTETDTCAGIATVVPASAVGKTEFKVTPIGKGDCTATFHGGNNETGPLSIAVAPPGSVVVDPSALVFDKTGPTQSKDTNVSQSNYTGAFTESSNCSGIASVSAKTNTGGKATYKVAPIAKGTCTVTFTGSAGESAPLSVTVAPPGNVVVNPTSLKFHLLGSFGTQFVDVSQTGFTGSFSESNDCDGKATIIATSNEGGHAVYKVMAIVRGRCTATFSGTNGQEARLPITVATFPPAHVVVVPDSIQFDRTGIGSAQHVLVGQLFFGGKFTVSGCAGIATLTATLNGNGAAAYRVVPLARGQCTATFTGGGGNTAKLAINVRRS
jgi:hypothetical protein